MADKETFTASNETKNVVAQCKVVIYPWHEILNNPNLEDTKLSAAGSLDISSQVQTVTFNKNMGNAAGSFSFTLSNSPQYGSNDWKDIIKRGYWCVIYMTNDGDLNLAKAVGPAKSSLAEAKRIRCVGYIERVGVRGTVQANRSLDIGFTVSGRDFGIIYEETNIWHNLFKYDKIMLDNIAQTKLNVTGNVRIHEAIKIVHDLFYFPSNIKGAKVNDNGSLLSIGLQWLLPRNMLSNIGFNLKALSRGTYWGSLPGVADLTTAEVPGAIAPSGAGIAVDKPGDYLSGNAWQQLKRLSVSQFHELFCELNDNGKPQLIFRPIPWGIDQSKYQNNAKNIKLYKELGPIVRIPAVDLYDFDLGEDDHSRYNSFLATVSTTLISVENNISLLKGSDFPRNNQASIKRHGFRPMHVTIDSIVKNEEQGNGTADRAQLIEFNEILYDYWNNAVFAESGSVEILGNNLTKIGKVMKFNKDVPYLSGRRYYIEGYTDTFSVDDNMVSSWSQNVSLTRGFEESDLAAKKGFLGRNAQFTGAGEYTKRDGESK